MTETRKIIDIAPLIRLPLDKMQSFSYLYHQEIAPGTLVSIPLFRRSVEGIVLGNRNDFERFGNIRLRPINRIISENFLTKKQLDLAQFLSDYYFAPLGIILKQFVPKIVRERQSSNDKKQEARNKSIIVLNKAQRETISQIARSDNSKFKIQNSKFLLYGPSSSGKTEVYIHSMIEMSKRDPEAQFLIVVPELTLTPQAIERYGAFFEENEIVQIHSKLAKGKLYSNWEKIKSGEAKVIIGSRMSVFAPFKNLKLIVLDEEHDISFKQWDMNPRYDARTVAHNLSEIHGANLVFGSATPRIEDLEATKENKLQLIRLPYLLDKDKIKERVILVNMCFERAGFGADKKKQRKNFSPISEQLRSEIEFQLKWKRQIILFINRQGMSNFSVCANCKTILKCPKCERALIYQKEGFYKCLHCNYQSSEFPECPSCHQMEFKNVGLGTQRIEVEISKLFPSAKIARLDFESAKTKKSQEEIYHDFAKRDYDILIGTQMVTKGWDLPNVGLVGIIDADQLFNIPDFRANERAVQHLMQAIGRAFRTESKIGNKVIIQTYRPENKALQMAAMLDYDGFVEYELEERKPLKLPPDYKLIKILYQDMSKEKVEKEVSFVYNKMSEMLKNFPEIRISTPIEPLASNIRGRHRKQMLIKIKKEKYDIIYSELRKLLTKLSSGWIIDVDPINVI